MIRKVGDAIGSQVLADVLVTALATGAALKAFSPKLPAGTDVKPGQKAGQATIEEMDKITSLGGATEPATGKTPGQIGAEIDQWNKAVTTAQKMRGTPI